MPSGFPGSIDNFTDPLSNSPLNSPSHSGLHADVNDAVEKIETYMGLVKVVPTSVSSAGGTAATLNSTTGTVTIGTSNTSVTVNGAFSSLYDNYRIIITGGAASTTVQLRLQIGNATTAYFWGFGYVAYATSVFTAAAGNNTGSFENIGYNLTDRVFLQCDVYNPNAAKHTQVSANSWFYAGGASIGYGGELRDTTQHTAFTIFAGSGTMTGGTIRIYGYRN